jgi:Ala-tRNA(Pro) deacylase
MNMNRLEVLDMLADLSISHNVIDHPAAHTVEELDDLALPDTDQIAKNLFLRDDMKQHYYLVSVQKDKTVNLKALRSLLGTRPLSFASEEELFAYLGLKKGAVTPFGLLNDEEQKACFVLDQDLLLLPRIGVHPIENTATVWLPPGDLVTIMESRGKWVRIVTF